VIEDTPAIREVAASDVSFRVVRTERPSSAEGSAALQGIDVDQLIRTIVVRRGARDYVFVLVPGGRQIDWPLLRAHLDVSRLSLPDKEEAREATGYERGTITPFASATTWPVVADATIGDRDVVAIGAGAHGVNLHLDPADLIRLLDADVADVTRPAS
jgi:Cys-tRNA(Pro)/Cys-tRNA(Cys) deacylase